MTGIWSKINTMKEIFQNYVIMYTLRLKNEDRGKTFHCSDVKANSFGNAELEFYKKYGNPELISDILQIIICN